VNHIFKRILTVSAIVCMLFSYQTVFSENKAKPETQNTAAIETQSAESNGTQSTAVAETKSVVTEELPLYEKLGYQEDFEYADEMIGHALKSTVVYVTQECEFTFTYKPLVLKTDQVATLITAYPNISKKTIAAFILKNYKDYFKYGTEETVTQQCISQGSGVILGDHGYIATNAHVVEEPTDAMLEEYVSGIVQEYWDADLEDIVQDMADKGLTITMDDLDFIEEDSVSYPYDSSDFTCEITSTNMKISIPTSDGKTDLRSANTYAAEVIKQGISSGENAEGLTQDIAILKIEEDNLVGLSLSNTYPEVNSNIVSGGFPAAANEIFEEIGYESTLSATIGTGKVARHIAVKGTDYKAMEITTTISQGSSGGPSVDNHLQIEGLNTYSNSSDTRFSYMVPAEAILDMAQGLEIEQGEISKTFLTGLQMLQQGYGKAAKDCFCAVQMKRRSIPYLDNLIQLAEDASQESPSPEETNDNALQPVQQSVSFPVILGITLLVIALTVIVFWVLKSKKATQKPTGSETTIPDTAVSDTAVADTIVSDTNETPLEPPVYISPESYTSPEDYSKANDTVAENDPTLKSLSTPQQPETENSASDFESFFTPGTDLDL